MSNKNRHTDLTDEQLLSVYRNDNDSKWLGILLQRYTTLLFGVAYKYLKNNNSAEDAVQQIFLKVLTNFPKEEIHNFKGWLYVLMRNHCLQQIRDSNTVLNEKSFQQITYVETDFEEIRRQEFFIEQMKEALNEIKNEQRVSIELFYLKKLSYEQIIARTGFTFMQVKSFIQNGKKNLKNILTKKIDKSIK